MLCVHLIFPVSSPAHSIPSIPKLSQVDLLERLIPKTELQPPLPHRHHIIHTNLTNLVCLSIIHSIDDTSSMTGVDLMLLQPKSNIKVSLEEVRRVRRCFQYRNLTMANGWMPRQVNGSVGNGVIQD